MRQIFRGIVAAASLKLLHGDRVLTWPSRIFRGINAAASLKLVQAEKSFNRTEIHLPRHQRRGLIEASAM
jgi:hypothetical protein